MLNKKEEVKKVIQTKAISIRKQPIVNTKLNIVGYEILSDFKTNTTKKEVFDIAREDPNMNADLDIACIENAVKNNGIYNNYFINIFGSTIEKCLDKLLQFNLSDNYVFELNERERDCYNPKQLISNIKKLQQETGIKLAIDDLGSGYDRTRLLIELEPKYTKIDMYLIQGVSYNRKKQINLKHEINKLLELLSGYIVLEGIEFENDLEYIIDNYNLDNILLQGYLIDDLIYYNLGNKKTKINHSI